MNATLIVIDRMRKSTGLLVGLFVLAVISLSGRTGPAAAKPSTEPARRGRVKGK